MNVEIHVCTFQHNEAGNVSADFEAFLKPFLTKDLS